MATQIEPERLLIISNVMPPKRRPKYNPQAKAIERSRRACRPKACQRCRAEILEGQSEDSMYWTARVDPTPVDEFDEAVGRLEGRASYALLKHGQGYKLDYRDTYALRRAERPDVVIDHVCISVSERHEIAHTISPWDEM